MKSIFLFLILIPPFARSQDFCSSLKKTGKDSVRVGDLLIRNGLDECSLESEKLSGLFQCQGILKRSEGVICLTGFGRPIGISPKGALDDQNAILFSTRDQILLGYPFGSMSTQLQKFPPQAYHLSFSEKNISVDLEPDENKGRYKMRLNNSQVRYCTTVTLDSKELACDQEQIVHY